MKRHRLFENVNIRYQPRPVVKAEIHARAGDGAAGMARDSVFVLKISDQILCWS